MTTKNSRTRQIEQAIRALEGQRAALGAVVVDASIEALRRQMALLAPVPVPPVVQQRKQVTLLYADVVDSTSISRHLDPEDVLEIMDGALKRLALPVEAQGGHVTRFQGDGFKAVFGTPLAHEDDPERAVRAGLGILEMAQVIAAELLAKHKIQNFAVRVGANTGLVMVGGQTEAEDTIMGESVILAARMESAAPPGGMLVSHNTYQHVQDLFEVKTLGPITVKGFNQPVAVYQVLRARPRPFWKHAYHVLGVETPMVGRNLELGKLKDAFHACVEDREAQFVTISGDPGIGKSRLLHELTAWIELLPEGAVLFRGRPDQDMQQRPYALLRDLFASYFGIQDSDPLPAVIAKFEQGVAEAGPYPEPGVRVRAHFIGQVLGYDFSTSPHLRGLLEQQTSLQQIQYRAGVYLHDLFANLAGHRPLALLLEDIHWADDLSLDLLNSLLLKLVGLPFFVAATARPALFERRPHWGEGQPEHTILALVPLSRRASRNLVEEILQKIEHLPEALRELIVSNGEGNPFYLEEVIKMLAEDGVIQLGTERWQVDTARLAQVRVPATLTAVLQARFDSLPDPERMALQRASVMGRIFWDDALIYLGGPGGCATCGAALAALRGREMVFQREISSVLGAQEYFFKHALLREATYESVLKRDRRVYHAAAARWLIERSRDRQAEFAAQIAGHLISAGQPAEAIQYLRQAGLQAAGQFANDQALAYFSQALDLLGANPEVSPGESQACLRFDLLLQRTRIYHRIGSLELEVKDVQILEEIAAALGPQEKIQAAICRAYFFERSGDFTRQKQVAQIAVDLAQSIIRVDLEAEALIVLANATNELDETSSMLEDLRLLEHALSLARQAGLKYLEPDIFKYQSMVYQSLHNNQAAYDAARQSCAISRELGDLYGEGRALAMMGLAVGDLGDVRAAIQYQLESKQVCHEAGNIYDESFAQKNLWSIYTFLGMTQEQADILRQGLEEDLVNIMAYWTVISYAQIAQFYVRALDPECALSFAHKALLFCQDHGLPARFLVFAKVFLGEALAACSRDEESLSCLQEAECLYQGADIFRMILLTQIVQFLTSHGRIDQARPYLEEFYLYQQNREFYLVPIEVYYLTPTLLIAFHGFQLCADPRAAEMLAKAHEIIENFSTVIKDADIRRSYRENLPWNREVLRLWAEAYPDQAAGTITV